MRTIGVVSVARSDYGMYLPLLTAINKDPELYLLLFVSGMHLSPEFGSTVNEIKNNGFKIAAEVETLLSSDTPEGISKSIGLGIIGFSQTFCKTRPDILVVLGDRFEMFAAVVASVPFKIPIAHIHGGEITEGAFDDALRHSITKFSHLHFVSTQRYAERVIQLGEEPWRVHVVGALGLDNLKSAKLLNRKELENTYNLKLEQPPLLVTFHPVTLEVEQIEWQVSELLHALEATKMPVVFTMPNADTAGRLVKRMIQNFVSTHPSCYFVDNFGTQGYFSMMAISAAMVGNSSSGILEAASFRLPVVNIGNRQRGRMKGANVIDVDYNKESIIKGIQDVLDPNFRRSLHNLSNLYGSGDSSEKIIEVLKQISIDDKLLIKRFHDLSFEGEEE
jgi:UDP-hydrolysing UDP-N-acetyl-D-glucosamine 2-epimerase